MVESVHRSVSRLTMRTAGLVFVAFLPIALMLALVAQWSAWAGGFAIAACVALAAQIKPD